MPKSMQYTLKKKVSFSSCKEHLCWVQLPNISHYSSVIACIWLDKTQCSFLSSNTSLSEGMMHNSAKNMTYISQEGVDMDGDMDRGALSSSNCNTVDIISTFFLRFSCKPKFSQYILPPKNLHERAFFHIFGNINEDYFKVEFPKFHKLQFLCEDTANCVEKVCLFQPPLPLATYGYISPAFSRNNAAYSVQQLATRASVSDFQGTHRFEPCQ